MTHTTTPRVTTVQLTRTAGQVAHLPPSRCHQLVVLAFWFFSCVTKLCWVLDFDSDTFWDALKHETLNALENGGPLVPEAASQSDDDDWTINVDKLRLAGNANRLCFSVIAKYGGEAALALVQHIDGVLLSQHNEAAAAPQRAGFIFAERTTSASLDDSAGLRASAGGA
eukprot:CAMPEP_0119375296 /NCGR_PEP_ID=MMETSP1334-20130426/34925_1 /TAXON_ID=127549 /ORGANISM="Calcidiscus leptoporus, Strain RCC1130" /LENGTH=168 /DNA_ID=CAMNT_0007393553 /DNA_START=92 /DNA_END=599 /DNA_ORIENTATION=+